MRTHRQHLLPILMTLPISSALSIPALPAVSEQPLLRQRIPSTNFPAWPGQPSVQPMFVKQSAPPIFPDGPAACTNLRCRSSPLVAWLPLPRCLDQQPFSSSLGLSSPEIPGALPDPIPSQPPRRRAPRGAGGDESERHGAESQWIVAARPLCHLQYPVAYLSRLQRILPAARWELYFKAARAALSPRGLGQRHVPPGPRGPYCRSAIRRRAHASHLARILT